MASDVSTPLLSSGNRRQGRDRSWMAKAGVLALTSVALVAFVGFTNDTKAPVELVQRTTGPARSSKLSSIFSAPLELAKNKIDQALSRTSEENKILHGGPNPCPPGSTSSLCSNPAVDKWMAATFPDSSSSGVDDCEGEDCDLEASEDDDANIKAVAVALQKKLDGMKEKFRLIKANFAHGPAKEIHIDVKPRGPRGYTGIEGNVGPTGTQGMEGAVGTNGPQGPTGPMGVQGIMGRTGEKGTRGSIGRPGIKGGEGPKGPIGHPGFAGPKGPRGLPGAAGVAGNNGNPGARGPPGMSSGQGPPGAMGPPGPQGPAGKAGDVGKAGPPGEPGQRGDSGMSGPPGANGIDGKDGVGPKRAPPRKKVGPLGDCWIKDQRCKELGVMENLCGQCEAADWRTCAQKGGMCSCSGKVRFGFGDKWSKEMYLPKGSSLCVDSKFENVPEEFLAHGTRRLLNAPVCQCAHGFTLTNSDPLEFKGMTFDDHDYETGSIQPQNVCLLARYGNNFMNKETKCADEGASCICTGQVRLGIDGKYTPLKEATGAIDCNLATFGTDPAPGIKKECLCSDAKFPAYPTSKCAAKLLPESAKEQPHYFGHCAPGNEDDRKCCLNSFLVKPGKDFSTNPAGNNCGGDDDTARPWGSLSCFGVTNADHPEHTIVTPEEKKVEPKVEPTTPVKPVEPTKPVVPEEDKAVPPDDAKLLAGGKSLINIHCATWRDHRGDKSVSEQKRFLAKCMAQDCEQSLEASPRGCRFMDDLGLCYAYEVAQEWCANNLKNTFCNDGGHDWATPPIGDEANGQYSTKWLPRKDAAPVNAKSWESTDNYSCSCMKNCNCNGLTKCWCVDNTQKAVGFNEDYAAATIYSSSSKKGVCSCSCGGKAGQ